MNEEKRTAIPFYILAVVILALVFGLGFYFNSEKPTDELETFSGQAEEPRDVFGTTTGTSTTATSNLTDPGYPTGAPNSDFSDATIGADSGYSTTSKVVTLNGMTDMALFTFRALTASTSGYFSYDIFGTNDTYATTTATSSTDSDYDVSGLIPIVSEINWYDIGSDGSRVSGSVEVGDVQYTDTGTTTSRLLTNLNWKYLKVDLRGSSTTVGVQLREKTNY